MNFHPLLVHFPVALLSIYSIAELVRFRWLMNKSYWIYVKAGFLLIGTVMGIVTILSGLAIEQLFYNNIVALHKISAISTITIYSVLSLNYVVKIIDQEFYSYLKSNYIWIKFSNLIKFIYQPWVLVILASAGFVAITFTAILGAIIAFGPGVDPFTEIVNNILFN